MANNKIILGNETLIDLTGDTVEADKLLQGYTAHDSSGNLITGTLVPGGGVSGTYFDAEKVRVTYTGEDLTGRTYTQATADLKALMPAEVRAGYYSIAGFEIVSDSFEEGDWVAGTLGYDYYGQRAYYWVWTNGRAVRNQNNYVQNAKGNLRSGMVADIFLLRFK